MTSLFVVLMILVRLQTHDDKISGLFSSSGQKLLALLVFIVVLLTLLRQTIDSRVYNCCTLKKFHVFHLCRYSVHL